MTNGTFGTQWHLITSHTGKLKLTRFEKSNKSALRLTSSMFFHRVPLHSGAASTLPLNMGKLGKYIVTCIGKETEKWLDLRTYIVDW